MADAEEVVVLCTGCNHIIGKPPESPGAEVYCTFGFEDALGEGAVDTYCVCHTETVASEQVDV
jgi:hypothetical protein